MSRNAGNILEEQRSYLHSDGSFTLRRIIFGCSQNYTSHTLQWTVPPQNYTNHTNTVESPVTELYKTHNTWTVPPQNYTSHKYRGESRHRIIQATQIPWRVPSQNYTRQIPWTARHNYTSDTNTVDISVTEIYRTHKNRGQSRNKIIQATHIPRTVAPQNYTRHSYRGESRHRIMQATHIPRTVAPQNYTRHTNTVDIPVTEIYKTHNIVDSPITELYKPTNTVDSPTTELYETHKYRGQSRHRITEATQIP
jgi:hypothetical protein